MKFATSYAAEKGTRMPIVISMSGNSVADQKKMYAGFIVHDCLQKPIRKRDLQDLIKIL